MTRVTAGSFVRPIAGERVSGDGCLIAPTPRGVVVALTDGLGHGPAAAHASSTFLACVREHSSEPLPAIFAAAHQAMLKTRGAVAVISRFDEAVGSVEIAGLGNVTTFLLSPSTASSGPRAPRYVVVSPGVVGNTLRTIRSQVVGFEPGDILVMHTDGVHSRFLWQFPGRPSPGALAEAIVTQHGKPTDDAGCAIVIGASSESRSLEPSDPSDPCGGDTVRIAIRTAGDAECCAVAARAFAARFGFDVEWQWELAIAVSELATNVLKFAVEGALVLRYSSGPVDQIAIEVADRGPAVETRMSPGSSLGVGLACVRRMTNRMSVDIGTDGARIVALKYRP